MENDFHEWKKRNHENRGILWKKKGRKMKVSFEWRRGKNDDFAAVFSHEINKNFEYIKEGTTMKIWTEA